jgi:hypothetical protein
VSRCRTDQRPQHHPTGIARDDSRRAHRELSEYLTAVSASLARPDDLAEVAVAYVLFALRRRALFG